MTLINAGLCRNWRGILSFTKFTVYLIGTLVIMIISGCSNVKPLFTLENNTNYKIKLSKQAKSILNSSESFIWTKNRKQKKIDANFCKNNIFCNHTDWDLYTYNNKVFYIKYIKGYNSKNTYYLNSIIVSEDGSIYIPLHFYHNNYHDIARDAEKIKFNGKNSPSSYFSQNTDIIFPYPHETNKSILTINGNNIQLNLPTIKEMSHLMILYKKFVTNYNYKRSLQYLIERVLEVSNTPKKSIINKKLSFSINLALGIPVVKNIRYNSKTEEFIIDIVSSAKKTKYINYAQNIPRKLKEIGVTVDSIKDLDFFHYSYHLNSNKKSKYLYFEDNIYCFSSICAGTEHFLTHDSEYFMNTNIKYGDQTQDGYDVISKRNNLLSSSVLNLNIGRYNYNFNLKKEPVYSQEISVKIPKKYAKIWEEVVSKKDFTPHLICKIENGELKIVSMKEAQNYNEIIQKYLYQENFYKMKKTWEYVSSHWNLENLENFQERYPNSPYKKIVISGIHKYKCENVIEEIKNSFFDKNDYIEWQGKTDNNGWPTGKGKIYISRLKDAKYSVFSYYWKRFINYNIYTTFKHHKITKGYVSAYYRQIGTGAYKDNSTNKYSFNGINDLYKQMKKAKNTAWRNHEKIENIKKNGQKSISIKHCHMEKNADGSGNYQSCEIFVNGSFNSIVTVSPNDNGYYQININDIGLYFPNIHQLSYGDCGKKNNLNLSEAIYYSAKCDIDGHY